MSSRRALLSVAAAAAAAVGVLLYRRLSPRTASTAESKAYILDPDDAVSAHRSGAVGSVQEAEIIVEREALERIWEPDNLELLARGYWAFLREIFFGLIQVIYAHDGRTVTLLGRIPLLRFGVPRYETNGGSGRVTWPIERGPLVAREGRGRGHLRVEVERCDRDGVDDEADAKLDQVRIIARVEVRNFYPGLRGHGHFARVGAWFYAQTQLRVHVIVCNAYLLSLPKLDFPYVDMSSMPSEQERPAELQSSGA